MKVKGDGIFSINTSATGGFGSAGISLPEAVVEAGGGGDAPPITDNLELFVNPEADVYSDAGTTLAVDGDNIRQVNDQSSNSIILDQSSASNQYVFKNDVLGTGHSGLWVQDSTKFMEFDSTLTIAGASQSITFYSVYDKTNTSRINYIYGAGGNVNFNRILEFGGNRIYFQDDTGVNHYASISNANDLGIRAFVLDTSTDNIKTYFNGTLIGDSTAAKTWGDFNFARFWGQNGMTGYIGQTLLYSEAHDSTQVEQVSDWLNDKYSIY